MVLDKTSVNFCFHKCLVQIKLLELQSRRSRKISCGSIDVDFHGIPLHEFLEQHLGYVGELPRVHPHGRDGEYGSDVGFVSLERQPLEGEMTNKPTFSVSIFLNSHVTSSVRGIKMTLQVHNFLGTLDPGFPRSFVNRLDVVAQNFADGNSCAHFWGGVGMKSDEKETLSISRNIQSIFVISLYPGRIGLLKQPQE